MGTALLAMDILFGNGCILHSTNIPIQILDKKALLIGLIAFGDGINSIGCYNWLRIWLLEHTPIDFLKRLFLFGFCTHEQLTEVQLHEPSRSESKFAADETELFGECEDIRIVKLEDGGAAEDPY